jgi:hypothetical protein
MKDDAWHRNFGASLLYVGVFVPETYMQVSRAHSSLQLPMCLYVTLVVAQQRPAINVTSAMNTRYNLIIVGGVVFSAGRLI